jgi:hypothetical protein
MRSACFFMRQLGLALFLFAAVSVNAQTTAFTYQGRLTDSGLAPNASYDMQFRLFDTQASGTQQALFTPAVPVVVTNGIFTVAIDFGACPTCFDGSDRYLEISLRPAGSAGGYTLLGPRHRVNSTPYAIRALSAGNITLPLTTRYVSINGGGFQPSRSAANWTGGFNIGGSVASEAMDFFAPLTLPHGATITELQATVFDNDATQDISVYLTRYDSVANSFTNLGQIASTGAAVASRTFTDPTIPFGAIDNSIYSYQVRAVWVTPTTPVNIRLFGVRVTYTITSPLP